MTSLEPLVGEWEAASGGDVLGRAVFSWDLDGRYLVQRTSARRAEADFSPLSFKQRFVGELADGVIAARWERDDGDGWKLDFELTYRRV